MNSRWKIEFLTSVAALHGRQLVRFFVSRLPDPSEAPDMAQEVYLRLLRLDRPELIRSPEAYLFTIAANIVHEQRLKRPGRPLHIAIEDAPEESLPADVQMFMNAAPENAAMTEERVARLEAVLGQLSPKARATLIWHRRDGQTYKEIGARLGVSTNMVKKYLAQTMAHCRKSLLQQED